MFGRLIRTVLAAALVVFLATMAAFLYLGWQINLTGTQDQAQAADAVIVLGARVTSSGEPGPDLRSRTLHGVDLYQKGLAPIFVCTGGYQGDRLSAASVACSFAVSMGVPAEQVLLADGSMTTGEDAVSAGRLAQQHGLRTALLVSHPLHLERARILFEDQGLTVYPSPTSTDLSAIPWPTRAWLTAREAAGILSIALEDVGIPYDWTAVLSRWVYGLPIDPRMTSSETASPPAGTD